MSSRVTIHGSYRFHQTPGGLTHALYYPAELADIAAGRGGRDGQSGLAANELLSGGHHPIGMIRQIDRGLNLNVLSSELEETHTMRVPAPVAYAWSPLATITRNAGQLIIASDTGLQYTWDGKAHLVTFHPNPGQANLLERDAPWVFNNLAHSLFGLAPSAA